MKPKSLIVAALLCFAVFLPVTIITTSCTTTQQTIAYNTLRGTVSTVDSAMSAYADLVVAGKVDQLTQIKVREIHGRYVIAVRQAIVTAKFNYASATPADVSKLAGELISALIAITK